VRCYRVASGARIAPFGDLARDLHVGVRTVAEAQEAAVRACGLELVDVCDISEVSARPALVFYDDVWFSEMALRQFAAAALGAKEDLALSLPPGMLARAVDPFDELAKTEQGGLLQDLAVIVQDAPLSDREGLLPRCRPWELPSRQINARMVLPPSLSADHAPGSREADAPITARIVAPVRHWVHVLRLSQMSVGVDLLDNLRRNPRVMFRLRWMRNRDPWKVARKLVFVHPTARVHPTADLEAAVIGPGAVVEAHAHVHRSVLGPGVRVGDHSSLVGCTLAEDVQVLRASYLALCASMPKATLASYKAQLSLFGREVFLTSSAWLIDAKLKGQVKVQHNGEPKAVGPFLGCCLGHRVTLGAQVLVQAGRAVPNDAVIVGSPERFLSQVPDKAPADVCTVRMGRLEAL